jgi:deoxyribonuclease V
VPIDQARPAASQTALAVAAFAALRGDWPATQAQAEQMQQQLRSRVIAEDALSRGIRFVAGVDVAYAKDESHACAGVAVIDAATLRTVETQTATRPIDFPYVSGLFAFRELPALLQALACVATPIDLLVCDGHGIAHPRRFGLASHLGVLLDLPSLGAAKTRLTGTHRALAAARGSHAALVDDGEVVGAAVRTQRDVEPIYVSIGHRVSLATAIAWTLRLCPRYRVPETTRQADQLVNRLRRQDAVRTTAAGPGKGRPAP